MDLAERLVAVVVGGVGKATVLRVQAVPGIHRQPLPLKGIMEELVAVQELQTLPIMALVAEVEPVQLELRGQQLQVEMAVQEQLPQSLVRP